jgi:hypothetical protein
MTLNKLASLVAKREGKRSQARIGDIREILGILCDIVIEDDGIVALTSLIDNGIKRLKRKPKGKPKGKRK